MSLARRIRALEERQGGKAGPLVCHCSPEYPDAVAILAFINEATEDPDLWLDPADWPACGSCRRPVAVAFIGDHRANTRFPYHSDRDWRVRVMKRDHEGVKAMLGITRPGFFGHEPQDRLPGMFGLVVPPKGVDRLGPSGVPERFGE